VSIDTHASELIDRDDERSLFREIVEEAESVRLLTICTGEKRGKSRLLAWFERESQLTFGVPAGRVEIADLKDRSAFGFAEHLVPGLKHFDLEFPTFDYFDEARAAQEWSAFQSRSPGPRANVVADGATVSGGFISGTVGTVFQGGEHAHLPEPRVWTGRQEEIARSRCADAFLEDLRALTERRRVLLLVDAWEECPPLLEAWIQTRLLLKHALTDNPTRLTVILAGQRIPDLTAGREQLVRALDSLSRWGDSHIEKFLEMRGVSTDPTMIDMVRRGLHEHDWTFDQLESFVALTKPRER